MFFFFPTAYTQTANNKTWFYFTPASHSGQKESPGEHYITFECDVVAVTFQHHRMTHDAVFALINAVMS